MSSLKAKILLVDDDQFVLNSISEFLSLTNYSILTANDGLEALEIVKEQGESIDLLITDIKMPNLNGLDLLLEVNKLYPQIRSIVFTAHNCSEYDKLANQRGAIVYAEKPIGESDLLKHVESALKSKSDSGFVGSVQTLSLEDVIQMYCISQLNAALMITCEINGALEEGIIYFEDGNITNAMVTSESNIFSSEKAFYHIMSWEKGNFNTRYGVKAGKKTIKKSCQQLLIEALKRKDEALKTEEATSTTKKTKGKEVKKNMATRAEQLKEILTNLSNELTDVETIAVVATDGTIFSSVSKVGEDASKVGAIIATIQGLSKRACQTLERGEQKEALIRGDRGYIALYPAGKKGSLGITTMPNANLGMLNLTAKEAAEKINKILG